MDVIDLEMTLSNGTICLANGISVPQCRGLCPSTRPLRTHFNEDEIDNYDECVCTTCSGELISHNNNVINIT